MKKQRPMFRKTFFSITCKFSKSISHPKLLKMRIFKVLKEKLTLPWNKNQLFPHHIQIFFFFQFEEKGNFINISTYFPKK